MNFGRLGDAGQPTMFAGRELPRGGFRTCRHCGTVQRRGAESFEHTRNCAARSDETGEAIVDCLYLYREFSSEAIRMLLPISDVLGSEQRVASFVAALELGLRRRFRGSLDHIRAMTCDNALAGANEGRRYLMLYDTVPGGTGYLKDLMTDRGELPRVFGMALEALKACECNREPLKDGCYRCVYAYRRSRDMALTSRSTAVAILESILDHVQDLEKVEGLDKVKVNPVLESELEARFIEALRRMRIDGETPGVRHDLVQGKPGYVLRVGERTWFVEPQVEVDQSDGVAMPSRPDFLLPPRTGGRGAARRGIHGRVRVPPRFGGSGFREAHGARAGGVPRVVAHVARPGGRLRQGGGGGGLSRRGDERGRASVRVDDSRRVGIAADRENDGVAAAAGRALGYRRDSSEVARLLAGSAAALLGQAGAREVEAGGVYRARRVVRAAPDGER